MLESNSCNNKRMFKYVHRTLNQFINSQSFGGVVLAVAAVLALLVSNSPWSEAYSRFLHWPGELRVGDGWLVLSKSLQHWVNDLWMAVFFFLVGLAIWVCVYKSGIHATLAGVVTALAIPLSDGRGGSPLERAEHALHPWVAFAVLPMFAFANAGVSLQGVTVATFLQTLPLGIAGGLVPGKVAGVLGASWLLIRYAGARLPAEANWGQFFGVCLLCGVGFTMSLFIGGLAFEGQGAGYETQVKLGVLCGSVLSGLLGTVMLLRSGRGS